MYFGEIKINKYKPRQNSVKFGKLFKLSNYNFNNLNNYALLCFFKIIIIRDF